MRTSPRGSNVLELIVVLTLLAIGLLASVPVALRIGARAQTAAAARELALLLLEQRWHSVAMARGHGLWFVRDARGWLWYRVQDANGNGLRTEELREGVDRTLRGPFRLEALFPRARLGFPGPGPFPRLPPRRGAIDHLDDPVQFGRSNVVAFGPMGGGSSGTIYLTDGKRELFAVIVFGPTARVRVWRFDKETQRWTL